MVQKVMYSDIESNRTQGEGGAFLINDLKRAVNELIDSGAGGAAIPEPNIIETNGVDVFSLTLGDYSVNRTSVWNSLINKPPVDDIKAIIHVRHTTVGENTYEVFRVIKDVTNNDMWVQSRGEGPAIDSGWAKLVNGNNLGTAATRDVGTSAGNVMEVGAGGLLTGEITNWDDFAAVVLNQGIRTELSAPSLTNSPHGIYDSAGRAHHFAFGNPYYPAGLFCDGDDGTENIKLTFYANSVSARRRFAVISHSGNLAQSTGQSTMYPMSQKAVTDVISDYSKPAGTILRSTIEQGLRDAYVIAVGDSTGAGEARFVGICAQKLAEKYPTHSVYLYIWNHAATAWGAPISISTGTGPRAIRVYNGSVPGTVAAYATRWSAHLFYPDGGWGGDGGLIDTVILNYGLNQGDDVQESAAISSVMDIMDRYGHPFDIVPIIQNPDYDLPERSAVRMAAQQRVYRAFGLDPVDSFSLFTDLVNNHGGTAAWIPDNVHPNAAGQEKLAQLVFKRLLNSTASLTRPKASPTPVPNGNFQRWPNGFVEPLFWSAGGGATSAYDPGDTGRAVKVSGGSGPLSGYLSTSIQHILQPLVWCRYIYVSARIQTTGHGPDVGILEIVRADGQKVQSAPYINESVTSPYRWVVLRLPREFFRAMNGVELRVLSGVAAYGDSVIIEEVMISTGAVPDVSDGNVSGPLTTDIRTFEEFYLAANANVRIPFDSVNRAVKGAKVDVTIPDVPNGILVSAWADDTPGRVFVQFSNITTTPITVPPALTVLTIE